MKFLKSIRALLIITCLLIIRLDSLATIYYLSNLGNDSNNGLSPGTSWRTLSKVNNFVFSNGDQVLLLKGDTFFGDIKVKANNMKFSYYGSGNYPVITGLKNASYSLVGANRYQSTISADSTLNLVLVNGVPQQKAIGANPDSANGGWKTFRGVKSGIPGQSWCRDTIRGMPTLALGSHLLIKQNDWSQVHVIVIKQMRDTVIFKSWFRLNIGGSSPLDQSRDGYGWKPYDAINMIDRNGEWSYKSGKLTIQLTTGTEIVQYAGVDTAIDNQGYDGTHIEGIRFIGYNQFAFFTNTSNNIIFTNCMVEMMGAEGFAGYRLNNSAVYDCTFSDVLGTAIYINSSTLGFGGIDVLNNTILRVGRMEGMGSWGLFGDYSAANVSVSSGLNFMYNVIKDMGDCGLKWGGSNVDVAYNWIEGYCEILQDHGGIYTYPLDAIFRNRKIRYNFISNGYGYLKGVPGTLLRANPIYLDATTGFVEIENNVCWNYSRGIVLNSDSSIVITNNILKPGDSSIYANARGIQINQQAVAVKLLRITNNTIILDAITQGIIGYAVPNIAAAGIIDSNNVNYTTASVYRKDLSPTVLYNRASFLSLFGHGLHDRLQPVTPKSQSKFLTNYSPLPDTISLDGYYLDPLGVGYNNSIILAPYTGAYIIKKDTTIIPPDPNTIRLRIRVVL